MKYETAQLLKAYLQEQRFSITPKDGNIEFDHDFTDEEIQAVVEAEYSETITQPVDELFKVIIRDLLKMGIDFAKKDENEKGN